MDYVAYDTRKSLKDRIYLYIPRLNIFATMRSIYMFAVFFLNFYREMSK